MQKSHFCQHWYSGAKGLLQPFPLSIEFPPAQVSAEALCLGNWQRANLSSYLNLANKKTALIFSLLAGPLFLPWKLLKKRPEICDVFFFFFGFVRVGWFLWLLWNRP